MDSPITLSPPHGSYSAAQWRPVLDRVLSRGRATFARLVLAYRARLGLCRYAAFNLAHIAVRRAVFAGLIVWRKGIVKL